VQKYWIGHGEVAREIALPSPETQVVPGVYWGRADMLDTPAYWALRCSTEENPLHGFAAQNASLLEEIGFCLLGGFGITAELNVAAFKRLKSNGAFDLSKSISEDFVRSLLTEPLDVKGKLHRYRFPNQRARRLIGMREKIADVDLENMPRKWVHLTLRDIPGIGPKTAAWIIRNHFDSDDVAILDVHVIRACLRLQLFPEKITLPRDYESLQDRFLSFASALNVRPAILDAIMWTEMRNEARGRQRLAA
jgi:thermostable 8-oxoguanine DNA glycosylase